MWPFGRRELRLGAKGERIARRFLRREGMKILATNYRCPVGEMDLIALDVREETLVFVEVKTRSSDRYVSPASAVNAQKRRRLRRIAEYYLQGHETGDLGVRFDIVSIVLIQGDPPKIEHIPGAF